MSQYLRPFVFILALSSFIDHAFAQNSFNREIERYTDFLENNNKSNIDYVLDLFQSHDVVVLTERAHNERTQWDFIYQLVSDQRFIDSVGFIFTEYFSSSQQNNIDLFLNADEYQQDKALELQRNFEIWPGWFNRNIFDFLKHFYFLNRSLGDSKKISFNSSDIPWDWTWWNWNSSEELSIKSKQYTTYMNEVLRPSRDKIIADHILAKFRDIEKSNSNRKKILVIVNGYHGFVIKTQKNPLKIDRVATYLYRELKDRVANVLINTVGWCSDIHNGAVGPINGGRWDAAFEVTGNRAIGFDFMGSPFGTDRFEGSDIPNDLKYQDVFSGLLFLNPLRDHQIDEYIPGFFDGNYGEVFLKRAALLGPETAAELKEFRDNYSESNYGPRPEYTSEFLAPINRWLLRP